MSLGMSLATFVQVHVIISLIGIFAGIVVMFGMLGSNRMPGLTAIFLLTTILTSATGFLIPPLVSEKLLPSHIIGMLSLVLLAVACIALYVARLSGAWRWIYVLTALISLYLNVFVLVIQSFLKIGPLHALAPGEPPGGPVFAVAQGIVLVFFIIMIIGAIRRLHPVPRLFGANPESSNTAECLDSGSTRRACPGMTAFTQEAAHAHDRNRRRH